MSSERVRVFKTAQGNNVTVWSTKSVEQRGFWTGYGRTVRTFITVEGHDGEWECEPGCAYQGDRVAREAGF